MMLCPQSTHMHTASHSSQGDAALFYWKVEHVWSRVGTAVEAFTQCCGDLSLASCSTSGHISFLLTATQLPSHDTDSTSTLKGTRVIPAASYGSPLPAETSVTAHIWCRCAPGNIARNFQNCSFLGCLFWKPSYKLSSRSSQVVQSHIQKHQHWSWVCWVEKFW